MLIRNWTTTRGLSPVAKKQSVQTEQTWTDAAHLNRIHHVLQGLVYFTARNMSKWLKDIVLSRASAGWHPYAARDGQSGDY